MDGNTTVLRTVTHKALKGVVSSREFIDLSVMEEHSDGTLVSLGEECVNSCLH